MKHRAVFLVILLLQLVILLGLVGYNEAILAFGRTVVLQTVPVDPRDLFRGDYVVLRYGISSIIGVPGPRQFEEGDKVYVYLEERDNVWEAERVSKERREDWGTCIAGEVTGTRGIGIDVEYGIEAYFVPEGEGKEIERAQDLKVRVTVDRSGNAIIKGLIVDGEDFQLR